jgi:hypothetical protein
MSLCFSGSGPSKLRRTGTRAREVSPRRSKLFSNFFVSTSPIAVTSRPTRRASSQNPPAEHPGDVMTSSTVELLAIFRNVTATPVSCDKPTEGPFTRPILQVRFQSSVRLPWP